MQRIAQFFRRQSTPKLAAPAKSAPVQLKAAELKKVAGGLPYVGGFTDGVEILPKDGD